MRRSRTTLLGLVGLVVFACLLLAGCAGVQPTTGTPPTAMPRPIPATSEPTASLSHTTMSPTSVKLAISHPPRLGETAYLTVTVVSVFDAPNSEARLKLPKGAVLLGGDLRWQGSLKANVPVQFSAAIKFVETGQKAIRAVARSVQSATSSVSDVDGVVLDVAETSGQFHVYDPRTPQPVEKLVPGHAPVTVYPDAPPVLSGTQPPAIPVPSAVPTPTSDPPVQRSESVPIGIKLAISHPPRLGETAYLTVTVVSVFDAPNSEARIELPDGARLVDGELTWQGALAGGAEGRCAGAVRVAPCRQPLADVLPGLDNNNGG